jgi:hypothetical protein
VVSNVSDDSKLPLEYSDGLSNNLDYKSENLSNCLAIAQNRRRKFT